MAKFPRVSKRDIADSMRKDYKVTREVATNMIDAVFCTIMEQLLDGKAVNLKGFGTFIIYRSHQNHRYNINTGRVESLPDTLTIKFIASKHFRNDLRIALGDFNVECEDMEDEDNEETDEINEFDLADE